MLLSANLTFNRSERPENWSHVCSRLKIFAETGKKATVLVVNLPGEGVERPQFHPPLTESLGGVSVESADVSTHHGNPKEVKVEDPWKNEKEKYLGRKPGRKKVRDKNGKASGDASCVK